MKKFSLINLLFNTVVCLFLATCTYGFVGEPALYISGALWLSGFVPDRNSFYPKGAFRNEVVRRIFSADVQTALYPDNSFYAGTQQDNDVAVDAVSVEIPQDEDGEAQVVRNPTKFPLEVYTEEDLKKEYSVDLLATKPQLITDFNLATLSYDKRAAKQRKHVSSLEKQLAESIMQAWGATKAEFIKQTTGVDVRAAHAKGATGNRKRVTGDDVLYFMSMFNDLNIPNDGKRRLTAPSYMYEDLIKVIEEKKNYLMTKDMVIDKGAIGIIYGYQIFLRSTTITYTEAATPVLKPLGAAGAATDNQAILFYHPSFVRHAKGQVTTYLNPNQGAYLGGTMNFALRGGGTKSRLSEIGVAALVEDNA